MSTGTKPLAFLISRSKIASSFARCKGDYLDHVLLSCSTQQHEGHAAIVPRSWLWMATDFRSWSPVPYSYGVRGVVSCLSLPVRTIQSFLFHSFPASFLFPLRSKKTENVGEKKSRPFVQVWFSLTKIAWCCTVRYNMFAHFLMFSVSRAWFFSLCACLRAFIWVGNPSRNAFSSNTDMEKQVLVALGLHYIGTFSAVSSVWWWGTI